MGSVECNVFVDWMRSSQQLSKMPRACPVDFTISATQNVKETAGCHGLAPWRFTFAAK